jgi:DNA-binding transcriptional MerR regulator
MTRSRRGEEKRDAHRELAEQVGVNPKTVRYYEQIGLIPPAPRTAGGYREYADSDAARLTFIKTAQRLGLSLEEVAEMLRLRERGEPPCGYVRHVISHQLRSVDKRIAELRALRSELRAAAGAIPEVDGATCRIIEHVKAATDPATARA